MTFKPYSTEGFIYQAPGGGRGTKVSDDLDTIKANFMHLEKLLIASSNPPSNPRVGQLWFDASTNQLKKWDGSGWVGISADTVDGFHASQTPGANLIPVSTKILHPDWLISPVYQIPYTRLRIGTQLPNTAILYDTFYKTNTNELFVFDGQDWLKIDWQKFLVGSPEYRAGKLRVNNGRLEISNNGSDWYQVIPTIGKVVEYVASTSDPNNDPTVLYLLPGQTFVNRGIQTYRARVACVSPMSFELHYYYPPPSPGYTWLGIFPSGMTISNGYGEFVTGSGTITGASYTTNRNFVPITEQAGFNPFADDNWAMVMIYVAENVMSTSSVGHGESGTCIVSCIGHGTFPSNGYYLGNFCYEGNLQNVKYFSITRTS